MPNDFSRVSSVAGYNMRTHLADSDPHPQYVRNTSAAIAAAIEGYLADHSIDINGELNDLTDVVISNPQNNDALVYDATNNIWINQSIDSLGLQDVQINNVSVVSNKIARIPKATTSVLGMTRFATSAEAAAGTLTDVAVTPSDVNTYLTTFKTNTKGSLAVYFNADDSSILSGCTWAISGRAGTHNSGDIVEDLTPGEYVVTFASSTSTTHAPASQTVNVYGGTLTTVFGKFYSSQCSITVNYNNSYIRWQVNGTGTYYTAGQTATFNEPTVATIVFTVDDGGGINTPESINFAVNAEEHLTVDISGKIVSSSGTIVLSCTGIAPNLAGWSFEQNPETWGTFDSEGYARVVKPAGYYTIYFKPVTGYSTPANATINVIRDDNHQVTAAYNRGALTVNITTQPGGAANTDGRWYLSSDPNTPHASGDVVENIPLGTYQITFGSVTGLIAPEAMTVVIDSTTQKVVNASYLNSSVTVTLVGADSTARWYLDNDTNTPRMSGDTVSGLAVGEHTISFKSVTGYETPASQTFTVSRNEYIFNRVANYGVSTGTLTVIISNVAGGSNKGEQWRLSTDDANTWRNSGTSVTLAPGSYVIYLKDISGYYNEPTTTAVTLSAGESLTTTVSYTNAEATLKINNPNISGAAWKLDSETQWRTSYPAEGILVSAVVGAASHTVYFKPVTGYSTPADYTFTATRGSTYTHSPVYGTSSIKITLTGDTTNNVPISNNTLQNTGLWSIDGGTSWHKSGETISGLTLGSKTIIFKDISVSDGLIAPASETVELTAAGIDRTYAYRTGSATVTLAGQAPTSPMTSEDVPFTGAQWSLDNGTTWNASGATVNGLKVGTYPITFKSVNRYAVPVPAPNEDRIEVVITKDSFTFVRTYTYNINVAKIIATIAYDENTHDGLKTGTSVSCDGTGVYTPNSYSEAILYVTPGEHTLALNCSGNLANVFDTPTGDNGGIASINCVAGSVYSGSSVTLTYACLVRLLQVNIDQTYVSNPVDLSNESFTMASNDGGTIYDSNKSVITGTGYAHRFNTPYYVTMSHNYQMTFGSAPTGYFYGTTPSSVYVTDNTVKNIYLSEVESDVYGVMIDRSSTNSSTELTGVILDKAAGTITNLGSSEAWPTRDGKTLPAHNFRKCLVKNGAVQYYLDPTDSTLKADGTAADLTGTDGDVMVEIKPVYFLVAPGSGTNEYWLISRKPFMYNGVSAVLHPYFHVGRASADDTTPYTQYLGAYESVACNSSGTPIATTAGGTSPTSYTAGYQCRSVKGYKPVINWTLDQFRAAHVASGLHTMNALATQFLALMMFIEYRSLDSQDKSTNANPTPDSDRGCAGNRSDGFVWYNAVFSYAHVRKTGRADLFGNGSGEVVWNQATDYTNDGNSLPDNFSSSATRGKKVVGFTYRGIENPFGHIFKYEDGLITDSSNYYWTDMPSKYVSALATADTAPDGYTKVAHTWPSAGYIKTFTFSQNEPTFFALTTGGSSTTYLPDYYGVESREGYKVEGGSVVFATKKVNKTWEETTWREVYIVAYYEEVKRLQDIYIDEDGLVQKKALEDKLIEIAKGYGFVIDHIEPEDWYERNQWVFAICVERQQEWIKGIASTSIPKEGSRSAFSIAVS